VPKGDLAIVAEFFSVRENQLSKAEEGVEARKELSQEEKVVMTRRGTRSVNSQL
jgi:hypothetical protein